MDSDMTRPLSRFRLPIVLCGAAAAMLATVVAADAQAPQGASSNVRSLGLLVQASPPATAQDFPTQHITFVVPFPPGGSIDVVLRAMATKLQARLGKPVLIENRVGGAGVVAAAAVAKSLPDGHTLYAAPSSFAANPKLYKTLPFDTLKDFAPLSLIFHTPLALVVNPDLLVQSVPELIALLKQKPGQISFAHSGPGSAI